MIKFGDVNNLVPKFGNESKYVLNYKNLQLHFSLGVKSTRVHRIVKFKQ